MRTSLFAFLLLLACCHDKPNAPPAIAVTGHKTVQPSRELGPLLSRLEYEASHRAHTAITAERALEALDAAQVHLVARRQFAGMSVHANYCVGGPTSEGVAVAVCEYPTHDAAIAGKAYMDKTFTAMTPSALRVVSDATVLTLVDTPDRSHRSLLERAAATFSTLEQNPGKEL